MLLTDTCTQRLCQPIGIYATDDIILILFQDILQGLQIFWIKSILGIHATLYLEVELLLCIHQVITRQVRSLNIKVTIVIDTQLTALRTYCLNNHHAVSSLTTIYSLGSSVFQDGDTLYAVHVHVIDFCNIGFKTVENEERLVRIALVITL